MKRLLHLTVATVAALGLGACAVLRIDVDVYKGPLANHEDVQIQELASLAIGAKPLLIELRDQIQWPDVAQSKEVHQVTGYRYGYVAQCVRVAHPVPWTQVCLTRRA